MDNADYHRMYYRSHKERFNSYRKKYRDNHPLKAVHDGMLERCGYGERVGKHKDYAGRGITVCTEWRKSFKAFEDWAMSHGWRKGLQLDRINNDGNYEPSNCRFVTPSENCRNRRNNIIVEYNGVRMTLIQAIQESGTKYCYGTVWNRIVNFGYTLEQALFQERVLFHKVEKGTTDEQGTDQQGGRRGWKQHGRRN